MRPDEPVSRIMTEAVVVIEADRPVSEVLDRVTGAITHRQDF
jgi:CBS domain-containing protein